MILGKILFASAASALAALSILTTSNRSVLACGMLKDEAKARHPA